MAKTMTVSPEELYYLGKFLQAKYIDYAYIASMSDISQNYTLFEKEAAASLVSGGVLTEDFSGNVELEPGCHALLRPIFFGESETSLDVCSIGEKSTVSVNKFHFYDGAVTAVSGENGKLFIKETDRLAIRDFISSLLPGDYAAGGNAVRELNKEKITRFIAAKSLIVGKTAVVRTFIECDGVMYSEQDGIISPMTREAFVSGIYDIVKGE